MRRIIVAQTVAFEQLSTGNLCEANVPLRAVHIDRNRNPRRKAGYMYLLLLPRRTNVVALYCHIIHRLDVHIKLCVKNIDIQFGSTAIRLISAKPPHIALSTAQYIVPYTH